MITFLPRSPWPAAEQMLDQMFASEGFEWTGFSADPLPDGARRGATGGSAILPARLRELRSELENVALRFGFDLQHAPIMRVLTERLHRRSRASPNSGRERRFAMTCGASL